MKCALVVASLMLLAAFAGPAEACTRVLYNKVYSGNAASRFEPARPFAFMPVQDK